MNTQKSLLPYTGSKLLFAAAGFVMLSVVTCNAQVRLGGQRSGRTSWSNIGARTVTPGARTSRRRVFHKIEAIVTTRFRHTSGRIGTTTWKYTTARWDARNKRWIPVDASRSYKWNVGALRSRGWKYVSHTKRYTRVSGMY